MNILNRKQGQEAASKFQALTSRIEDNPQAMAAMQSQSVPIRRPLVEQIRAQTILKEAELRDALSRVDQLTAELREFRREEIWLTVNPEFDKVFERLSNGRAKAATP